MIVIEASGGLGNQMFQYALYKKLESMNKDVALDTSFFRSKQSLRELEIGVFGVQYKSISDKEAAYIRGYGYKDTIFDKIMYKLLPKKYRIYRDKIEVFQPEIMNMDQVYLSGYWQCESYFKDIRNIILKEYTFPLYVKERTKELCREMEKRNSVSIHVRRSDYLTEQNMKVYGNICTEKYYKAAVAYMETSLTEPHYFVFTDDVEWAKRFFIGEKYTIVDRYREKDSYVDMFLMSRCKHNIIANSSFSWWGAWLNENPDKIVVSPNKWMNNHEEVAIFCDNFVRIEG